MALGSDRECSTIEAADGSEAFAYLAYPVYATAEKDIGLRLLERAELKHYPVIRVDFSNGIVDIESNDVLFKDFLYNDGLAVVEGNKTLTFKHRVYNIEVEDFHTYYVGPHGIWVHNTSKKGGLTIYTSRLLFIDASKHVMTLLRELGKGN